ncbi:MAG: hypothetical protein IJC78_00600 [Clostridia bacterium]|nr:hypothetical protein [Clostridia bacterium]
MKRQISFFNKTVFRADVKRFWWIPILHTLAIVLTCLVPFYERVTYLLESKQITGYEDIGFGYINSHWSNYCLPSYFLLFVAAVVLSMLLFSYLNKKSAVATAHAQPVTRLSLYVTHILYGLLALIVPVVVISVALLFVRSDAMMAQVLSLSDIWTWAYTTLTYSAIAFSLTTCAGMLVGNVIAQPIFACIFAALPIFAEVMVKGVATTHLYGYSDDINFITQKLYLGVEQITEPSGAILYLVLSVVFLALGFGIYKLRHLENHGEVIAFPRLKPVFVYGVALCAGFLGFAYIYALTDMANLLFMIPFGIVGLLIANFIAKKAFTVKGAAIPASAFLLTVLVLICVFAMDITGYESRIPNAEDIESVTVSEQNYNHKTYYRFVKEKDYIPVLTEKEDIENALAFHQYKIDVPSDETGYINIYITYHLKNGKTMLRTYSVDFREEAEFLKPIMETEENKKERFPILREPTYVINFMEICDRRLKAPFGTYHDETGGTEEEKAMVSRLTEALRKDLAAAPYEEFIEGEATDTYIRVNRRTELIYVGTDVPVEDPENYVNETEETYYIRDSYVNTIAILRELGLYGALPTAEDYTQVRVNRYITQPSDDPNVRAQQCVPGEDITDPAVIGELYRYVTETPYLGGKEGNLVEFIFVSPNYSEYCVTRSMDEENVPESIRYLFE